MFTFGEFPWYGVSDVDVVRKTRRGEVMLRPSNCPEQVFQIMVQCWQVNPATRVTAADLERQLRDLDVEDLAHIKTTVFSGPVEPYRTLTTAGTSQSPSIPSNAASSPNSAGINSRSHQSAIQSARLGVTLASGNDDDEEDEEPVHL